MVPICTIRKLNISSLGRRGQNRTLHLVSTLLRCESGEERPDGELTTRVIERPLCSESDQIPQSVDIDMEQLYNLMAKFKADATIKKLANEHLIISKLYNSSIKSFGKYISKCKQNSFNNKKLLSIIEDILTGSASVDALFPYYLSHTRSSNALVGPAKKLLQSSNLCSPASWFPEARAINRKIIYHAGPTNSGKTYHAIQHLMSAKTGIYCAPLRLLAHEIFHHSNQKGIDCDLLTGEESQFASGDPLKPSSHLSCTIEMAFSNSFRSPYDVAVVDEIQMIADPERGWAWTRALLGLSAVEIHLCGHRCAIELVKKIVATTADTMEVHHYERLAPLVPSEKTLKGSYNAIKPGDCVVTFSRKEVFEICGLIEKATKQSCAVIYGDLPPAIRVQQADLFNDPNSNCNVMVATDAIGMGLNLNIGRVIFYSLTKFDGTRARLLTPAHTQQIAGRAGRYGKVYSKGFVTTFCQKEFIILQELLKSHIKNTKKAGLYPTLAQIEHFSLYLPQAKLYEILTLFCEMARLDGIYFLCDVSDQMELAYKLRNIDMDLEFLFSFTLAPVDLRKKMVIDTFVKFAEFFSEGQKVNSSMLCGLLGSAPAIAKSAIQLAELELKYEVVNLYLWLSMRFPVTFVDVEEAHLLQEIIEEHIGSSLEQRPSLKSALRFAHVNKDGRKRLRIKRLRKRVKDRRRNVKYMTVDSYFE